MEDSKERYQVPKVDGFIADSKPVYVIMRQHVRWPVTVAASWNSACAYFEHHGMDYVSQPGAEAIDACDAGGDLWRAIRMAPVHYTSPKARARRGKAFKEFLSAFGSTIDPDWRKMIGEEE